MKPSGASEPFDFCVVVTNYFLCNFFDVFLVQASLVKLLLLVLLIWCKVSFLEPTVGRE